MTPEEVKEYYGSQYNFHKKTKMAHATLGNWIKWGFVPEDAQYRLERLTKGALKVEYKEIDEEVVEPKHNPVKEARLFLKSHKELIYSLLRHLRGNDEGLKNAAVVTAWCLSNYIHNNLKADLEKAMNECAIEKE